MGETGRVWIFAIATMAVACESTTITRKVTLAPSDVDSRTEIVSRHGDTIIAKVTYKEGDTIPGEGVVRLVPDHGLITGGAIALGAGIALGIASGVAAATCNDSGIEFACLDHDVAAVALGAGGIITGVLGLVFLAIGGNGYAKIEQSAVHARVTPRGLELRF